MNTNEQLNNVSKSAGLLDDAIKDGTFDLDFVKNLVAKTDFKVPDSQLSLFWSGNEQLSDMKFSSKDVAGAIGQTVEFENSNGSMIVDRELGKFLDRNEIKIQAQLAKEYVGQGIFSKKINNAE